MSFLSFLTKLNVKKRARSDMNCPILCGQYKKEPLVGKIEF